MEGGTVGEWSSLKWGLGREKGSNGAGANPNRGTASNEEGSFQLEDRLRVRRGFFSF